MQKEKVKLFSQDVKTQGKLITLPLIGDTQFSEEDNSIEIDEDKVEELLILDFGIKLINEEEKEKIGIKIKETEEEKAKKIKEREDTLLMLKALDENELEKLAIEYPEEETKKLKTKSSLMAYLCKKILNSK